MSPIEGEHPYLYLDGIVMKRSWAGEVIETREWPHASFRPLNYGAKKVLDFFNLQMKSRLPRSPWYGDRLRLDNGLSDTTIPSVTPPQLQPMDLRPGRPQQ